MRPGNVARWRMSPVKPIAVHSGRERKSLMTLRNGLDSLLRPEDSVLVLIDHQPYQLANLNSHDPQMVVNNTTALAKLAKAFNVPTILTSVIAARGGLLFKQITDVFPGPGSDRSHLGEHLAGREGGERRQGDRPQAADHRRPVDRGLRRNACHPGRRRRLGRDRDHRRVGRDFEGVSRSCHPANDRGRRERDDRGWRSLANGSATGRAPSMSRS